MRFAMRWMLVVALIATMADPLLAADAARSDPSKAVIHLLRENRQKYGDDAAILQGLLLVNATRNGAIFASEVAIVGFEARGDRRFVSFRVESGAILDDDALDRNGRVEHVWRHILERSLLRYPHFSVPGDGIAVEIGYHHRPWGARAELQRTLDSPGPIERAKFYLLSTGLTPFVERELGAADLLRDSEILLDGSPIESLVLDWTGPPEPDADAPEFGSLY